jgi:hypothetical protein
VLLAGTCCAHEHGRRKVCREDGDEISQRLDAAGRRSDDDVALHPSHLLITGGSPRST